MWFCVCVCVSNTTKLQKNYMLKCPFFMVRNGQFLRDWKASHSHCIWMSTRPIHVAFHSCWFTLKGVCCCCEEIWSKREKRVFEDDVFIENTRLVGGSKTQDLNLRADVVLSMSRGPSGQWFPETEYWASAIFVGTSGIPPKIIYRSVKSYTHFWNFQKHEKKINRTSSDLYRIDTEKWGRG